MLGLAISIASNAHVGQLDKNGKAYILHPLAVMAKVRSQDAKIVAVLHDTIEDTTLGLDFLSGIFKKRIIDALDAISKTNEETYFEYIGRVSENKLATEVKIADLRHNSLPERAFEGSKGLEKRYYKALVILTKK